MNQRTNERTDIDVALPFRSYRSNQIIATLLLPTTFSLSSSLRIDNRYPFISFFAAFFFLSPHRTVAYCNLPPPLRFSLVVLARPDRSISLLVPRDFPVKRTGEGGREGGWRLAILTDREEVSQQACHVAPPLGVVACEDRSEVGTKNEDGIKGRDEMNP